MATKFSFIVSHKVEDARLPSAYYVEELKSLLENFYADVEVTMHYILPDADEVKRAEDKR